MYVLRFVLLLTTWLILSGRFDGLHVGLGVLSSAIVAYTSRDMVLRGNEKGLDLGVPFRFASYTAWFMVEMVRANLQVLQIAFAMDVEEHLSPCVVEFETRLTKPISRLILANSITLTPGTVTITVDGSRFQVHALTREMGAGLPGEMEKRVAAILGEDLEAS